MKKIILFIFLSTMIFCGCEFALDHQNAVLFFSPRPITEKDFEPSMAQDTFGQGQIIYFCLYSKIPFDSDEGLVQIFKKDPNTQLYGYSLYQGKGILLNPSKNYYTNSFTIYSEGCYLIKIFSQNNLNEPLAQNIFFITQ